MRKIITLFCLGVLLVSCSSNNDELELGNNMIIVVEDDFEEANEVLFLGDFISAAHPTSGVASVNDDGSILNFQNFKTDNGPKLLVYLATDADASEFINLGDLKGVEGNYSYTIPSGTAIEKYKIVNIWCVDFSISFGYAELKK